MPRTCCVPGCRSNYKTEAIHTTTFCFPNDKNRHARWLKCINRKDYLPSLSAGVCIKHFDESMIVREDRAARADGSILVVPRKKLALVADAYPTIFPNQPSYLTKQLPKKRKLPSERCQEIDKRDEEAFSRWCADDTITSFELLKQNVKEKLNPGWLCLTLEDCVIVYKINTDACPKVIVSIKIYEDLAVCLYSDNMQIDIKKVEFILSSEQRCNKWSKLECLTNFLNSYQTKDISIEEKLLAASKLLKDCCDEDNDDNRTQLKLNFLLEQMSLIASKQLRYSPELIFWASKFYFTYPAAYSKVRESDVLILPNPRYLRKLTQTFNDSSETENVSKHVSYLKKKNQLLDEHEKIVNLLLDEIYITPTINYKGGNIVGISDNSKNEASTIHTFMISSLLSKNKDVVALIPVKNLVADQLYTYTLKILEILNQCGYTVLSLISDNNRINRNMFTMFCGGRLTSSINNPYDERKKMFFLFDTPHLIKSVRNNWLNQKDTNQTFFYPDPNDPKRMNIASMLHFRKIYDMENNQIVKQAPRLTRKVLFPSSTERQNVNHALNLFHESNIVALEQNSGQFGSDLLQTKEFVSYISKWWKIVNCKHPLKGKHLRDLYCDPVLSVDHHNMLFLKQFSTWLNVWKSLADLPKASKKALGVPEKGGMLSRETEFALHHTTSTLIEMVDYIFQEIKPKYILLGKFQTDILEARFGLYRQMSGSNYHVSLRQVLESEKKLKVLSLITLQSSKSGQFTLKDFFCAEFGEEDSNGGEVPECFSDVVCASDETNISDQVLSVLIYIAGYVAHKVQRGMSCQACILTLSCDRTLTFESCEEEVSQYLKLTDRGGLKWPQEFTVKIVISAFQIFEVLISEEFEERFLEQSHQKNLLINLTKEKISASGIIPAVVCNCCRSSDTLIQKCLSVISNILLNNYCKAKNDKIICSKNKRKLSTLTNSCSAKTV